MSKRILILGGGIAGTATAWFLARLGASDVCLIEKEEQLGSQATAQNASILRTWTPDPVTCAMAVEGARFLTSPPAGFSDRPLVDHRGLIVSGSRDLDNVSNSYALCDGPAPDVRLLTPSEFGERAPHFASLENLGDSAGMLFPNEGTLDVPAVVQAFREGARAAGVRILPGKKVTGWIGETGRVTGVQLLHGERVEADAVVLAAGAWAAELGRLAGSSVPLRPTRRHIVIARSAPHAPRIPSKAPIVWSDGARFYAR
ncbi:MAG: FAD-dependent oxidoreductase, partial [Planctomycetota bacterium]